MRLTTLCLLLVARLATAQLPGEILTAAQKAELARQDEFQVAIAKQDAARVRALIRAGMRVDFNFDALTRGRSSESPLTMAINRGHLEIARILLEAGADPNRRNGSGAPALQYAKTNEALDLLLRYGADINAPDQRGRTALAEAVERGDQARIELLVRGGARANVPGGTDIFTLALQGKHPELIATLLAHGADPRTPPTQAVPLLVESGNDELAVMLIERGADPDLRVGREWLITRALFRQRWAVVDALVAAGANLRLPDGPDCAATMRECNSIFLAQLASLNPPTLARMKARGLDLNTRAAGGSTALAALVIDPQYGTGGAGDVVARARVLLEQGADPNIAYRDFTPLMLAIALRPLAADVLLDHGGRVEFHYTVPKEQAPARAYLGNMALAALSEPPVRNGLGHLTGMTVGPLTWVAVQRDASVAARLLARDRKLEAEDRFLLYFAALLRQWQVVLQALPYAKDIDAADRAGVTPLMLAANAGRADVVKALLSAGARVNARSAAHWPPLLETPPVMFFMGHPPPRPPLVGGYTALKAAQEAGHEEVVKLLRAAGGRD
ncbi:MAG TPA: ankyrin repeat domain-containing protein [Burkholderiales bacterium]|nr:ankyrin repeat domain-containing protein [Burkholderiales bacterium]